ncbi:MAG: hypothetical protein CMO59_15250 [Verrucomicrobiales bacterium]|nr:hypothetical protein [Verrucomicrobiales bacterium]
MGIRVRPIGEMKSQPDPSERVKCWKCETWFMMDRSASRASCPNCGSQVALHRLKMPMMPSGKEAVDPELLPSSKRQGLVRLPGEAGTDPLERGVASGSKLDGEEIRRMFVEADPRREGGLAGREMLEGISPKVLIAVVGVAALILLVLIFLIER